MFTLIVTTETINNMPILVSRGEYMQYRGGRYRTPLLHPNSVESSKNVMSVTEHSNRMKKKQGKHTL